MHQKFKRMVVWLLLTVLFITGCANERSDDGTADTGGGGDTLKDRNYLLTVDGYGVKEEEYLLFLRDQKAATANHYWVNYKVQPDSAFWETEFDGQTPLQYAKEKALQALVRAKQEFILAKEWKIADYKNYDEMMEDMAEENRDRAEKQSEGDVIYGLSEFAPFTYYNYLNNNVRSELKYDLAKRIEPTKEQLLAVYEAHKTDFSRGIVYHYTVTYEDGKTESYSQNSNEVGKADETLEYLVYQCFPEMNPGEKIKDFSYHGSFVAVTLDSTEDLGVATLEEVKESVYLILAEEEVNQILDERCKSAEIKIDQICYDRLKMN